MRRAAEVGRDDFAQLFAAYAISLFGSLVASGVVAWIALDELSVTGTALGFLLAGAGLTAALIGFSIGAQIDRWHKRRLMVVLNVVASSGLLSLSVAIWADKLTVLHLYVVASAELAVGILLTSATAVMLKEVAGERLDWANGRLESVFWIAQAAGPPLGGVITSSVGPAWTVAANSTSFLASGLILRRMQASGMPAKDELVVNHSVGSNLLNGFGTIWSNNSIRLLYINAMIFGASVIGASTVLALFIIRDLDQDAWRYGIVLGLPCLAGIISGHLSDQMVNRSSRFTVLRAAGILRTVWLAPIALVPAGFYPLAWLVVLQSGLLFTAGLFNPVFATIRMSLVPSHRLGAVVSTWSASSRTIQPIGVVLGGLLSDTIGTRPTLLAAGAVCLASSLPLLLIDQSSLADASKV